MSSDQHIRWYQKKSRGWEYLRSIPASQSLALYLAVFLLFSTIGFYSDLMNGGHLPYAAVVVSAILSGITAVLWIYVLAHRSLIWIALPLVVSSSVGFIEGALDGWIMTGLHRRPVAAHVGIVFSATTMLVVILLSYVFFIIFISREGSESVKLRTELELAHGIQKTLVPPFTLRTERFELYGISRPSEKVGGDLVDAVALPDGDAIAYLGDIAGHGLQAGILMGMLKIAARTALLDTAERERCESLPALLERLNTVLPSVKEAHMYATLTAFRPCADGGLFYAMAASPPVLHWHADGLALSKIEEEQYPLGLLPVSGFAGGTMPMSPGDLLVVATDGVLEACSANGEEFGLDRLEHAVAASAEAPLPQIAGKILDEVNAFGKQTDDQTILLIRRFA